MKATATLALCLACIFAASKGFSATDKVYKWTDAKGHTHYAQRPPLDTKTETIRPATGHSEPVKYETPSATTNTQPETNNSNTVAINKFNAERCEKARQNAEVLNTTARIRVKGDDGEYSYLSTEERAQKLDEANQAIKESCK